MITIKQEPIWQHSTITASANDINEYIARQTNLQQFLKFDNDNLISIKRDEMTDTIEEFQQQEKVSTSSFTVVLFLVRLT